MHDTPLETLRRSSVVSCNWLDSVAPTFRSAGAGLEAGATLNSLASYFVDTTLARLLKEDRT